jgi:sarcosine oxidase subunit alpha
MREESSRESIVTRGAPIDLVVDGEVVHAYLGETIAGALVAAGHRVFRHAPRTGAPRGVYCGIGACFECVVTVEGMGQVRSCMVAVQPGMRVSLGHRRARAGEESGATG